MKQFLSFNDQEKCYQCLCEFFNVFRCFRFKNWNDNSVSIFIDKIDSPDSKIDNYRLLTTKSFIDSYRISKKLIDFYRLLSTAMDYRYYRLTTPGSIALRAGTAGAVDLCCYKWAGYSEISPENVKQSCVRKQHKA